MTKEIDALKNHLNKTFINATLDNFDAAWGVAHRIFYIKGQSMGITSTQRNIFLNVVENMHTVNFDFSKPLKHCDQPYYFRYSERAGNIVFLCSGYDKSSTLPEVNILGKNDVKNKFGILTHELLLHSYPKANPQYLHWKQCSELKFMIEDPNTPSAASCFSSYVQILSLHYSNCQILNQSNILYFCSTTGASSEKAILAADNSVTVLSYLKEQDSITEKLQKAYETFICAKHNHDWVALQQNFIEMDQRFALGVELHEVWTLTEGYTEKNSSKISMSYSAVNYQHTFFHELSHATISTDDHGRGEAFCKNIASKCQFSLTSTNADCIAFFMGAVYNELIESNGGKDEL